MTQSELNKEKPETENSESKRGSIYDIVQIYDTTCNKIRNARNFKISSFEEFDENGDLHMRKSIEFIIVGNNRTWKMFIPYDDFKKANPEVELPGEPK